MKVKNNMKNKISTLSKLVALPVIMAVTTISCDNETEFRTSSNVKRKDTSSQNYGDVLGGDKEFNDLLGGEGTLITTALATAATENSVWVVNSAGVVTKIELNKEADYPTKVWTGANGGGHRTYVTKIGLIVGANGGHVFRANDDIPEGNVQKLFQAKDANSSTRICLTSYKIGPTEYIGGGYYDNAGKRRFVSVPIDKTKPNKIDLSSIKYYEVGNGQWGYSCATDQARKYFWSKDNSTRANISGINLTTGAAVAFGSVPNSGHSNNSGAQLNLANNNQSYSMSTDLLGNILSFTNGYSAAHETLSDTIFVSLLSSNKIVVIKGDCVRNKACGANDSADYDLTMTTNAKPLSSLNDGRIVGLSRSGSSSDVSLLSLKDPTDINKGLDVEVIKTVPGDAYMYADFTGATIYASTEVKPVNLNEASGFKKDSTVKTLYLRWNSESGMPEEWRGLSLSVKCYQSGAESGASFAKISNVPVAGDPLRVAVASCVDKVYDTVEIKVEPDGVSSIYSKTKTFDVVIKQ
jgi:hypothetical protein